MKKTCLALLPTFFTIMSYSQMNKLVGAWYWRDSSNKKQISLIFKKDSIVTRNSGMIMGALFANDNHDGNFLFKDNGTLIIKWADGTVENDRIKYIDKFTIQITDTKQNTDSIHSYIFKKVGDEEVK